jgi:hypothetical protein
LVQLRDEQNLPPEINSDVDLAFKWFFSRLRLDVYGTNLSWPDMAKNMARFGNDSHKARLDQHINEWVISHLERI